jgi:hypothetical protein
VVFLDALIAFLVHDDSAVLLELVDDIAALACFEFFEGGDALFYDAGLLRVNAWLAYA